MNSTSGKKGTPIRPENRCAVLEAILFASDRPLTVENMATILDCEPSWVEEGLQELEGKLLSDDRGIRLRKVHSGYELVADPRWLPYLNALRESHYRIKLSRPALETLAVIAYHQPITIPEINRIRGVDSTKACKQLLRLNLIRVMGRKPTPGRPRIYGTTPHFLDLLGLESIEQLLPWESFMDTSDDLDFPDAEPAPWRLRDEHEITSSAGIEPSET